MRTSRGWGTIRKANSMHPMTLIPRDKVLLHRTPSSQTMLARLTPRRTRRMLRTKRRRRARSQRRTRKRRMIPTMTQKIAAMIQTQTQIAQVKRRNRARRSKRRKRRARASWEKLPNLNVKSIKTARSQWLVNLPLQQQPSRQHLRPRPLQRTTCSICSPRLQQLQLNRHHPNSNQVKATLASCNRPIPISHSNHSSHPSKTQASSAVSI